MHPNPNSLLPLHSSSTSSHSSSSSSFSFSKVTAGVESATNHLSTLPPKGATTGAFNVNNMPSSGSGAMLNRKDVADEADEEDFFMKDRSTTRKTKRVPEAPAPPNTLVQNSEWDGSNFGGDAIYGIKSTFITRASENYAATVGTSHIIKETGGVNNRNGLVIQCDTDGKCSWDKRECPFGLKAKLTVKGSLSKALITHICLEHSQHCQVSLTILSFDHTCN